MTPLATAFLITAAAAPLTGIAAAAVSSHRWRTLGETDPREWTKNAGLMGTAWVTVLGLPVALWAGNAAPSATGFAIVFAAILATVLMAADDGTYRRKAAARRLELAQSGPPADL